MLTMSCLRRHRVVSVLVALCSLLFMQMAVAGYSCPGFQARVQEISAMAQAGMPCAQEMAMTLDDGQPNLCSAHCQSAQSASGDHALQMPALADCCAFFASPVAVVRVERFTPEPALLAQAAAPPLAIRNCCWRI